MSDKKKDELPLIVKSTKCTTKTNSHVVHTKHGAVRVEVKSPVNL